MNALKIRSLILGNPPCLTAMWQCGTLNHLKCDESSLQLPTWHSLEPNNKPNTSVLPQSDTICALSRPATSRWSPEQWLLSVGCTADEPWPHLRVAADNKSSTFKWSESWWINKVDGAKKQKSRPRHKPTITMAKKVLRRDKIACFAWILFCSIVSFNLVDSCCRWVPEHRK